MLKKTAVYSLSFLVLLFTNFFLQLKLNDKLNREQKVKKILTEIEEDNNIAKQFNYSNAPFSAGSLKTEVKTTDGRAVNLKVFFRKHGSPLYDFADVIVRTSDNYGFDYRLLPAIAMQESTLCRAIPENSHNCWGWGIYGNIVTRFDSYEEAIEIVAKGIKTHYLDKGLTTASTIMAKYTPSSPEGAWAKSVNQFLRALE
ncbi:hypothetical protein A3D76_06815 [Candidatus Roizmanbacteria bacterium RIFCSPHIGHO2_02_FULL_37_9b]|nr:MAG: hypothetical protein A3D76_06815 [Candidatus Roizmanbacteria bacterium RIFCSPHIGHO2_02_FULL_37_9b]